MRENRISVLQEKATAGIELNGFGSFQLQLMKAYGGLVVHAEFGYRGTPYLKRRASGYDGKISTVKVKVKVLSNAVRCQLTKHRALPTRCCSLLSWRLSRIFAPDSLCPH